MFRRCVHSLYGFQIKTSIFCSRLAQTRDAKEKYRSKCCWHRYSAPCRELPAFVGAFRFAFPFFPRALTTEPKLHGSFDKCNTQSLNMIAIFFFVFEPRSSEAPFCFFSIHSWLSARGAKQDPHRDNFPEPLMVPALFWLIAAGIERQSLGTSAKNTPRLPFPVY